MQLGPLQAPGSQPLRERRRHRHHGVEPAVRLTLEPLVEPVFQVSAGEPVHRGGGGDAEALSRSTTDDIGPGAVAMDDIRSQVGENRAEFTILPEVRAGRQRNPGDGNPGLLQAGHERVPVLPQVQHRAHRRLESLAPLAGHQPLHHALQASHGPRRDQVDHTQGVAGLGEPTGHRPRPVGQVLGQ